MPEAAGPLHLGEIDAAARRLRGVHHPGAATASLRRSSLLLKAAYTIEGFSEAGANLSLQGHSVAGLARAESAAEPGEAVRSPRGRGWVTPWLFGQELSR